MKITVIGIPTTCGGANVELGHTILLWLQAGIDVTVAEIVACTCKSKPTRWQPDNPWRDRLLAAGCKLAIIGPDNLRDFSGRLLAGMCNQHCAHLWPQLAERNCRLIWSPCMNYPLPSERIMAKCPPTAVHFQSQYQDSVRRREFETYGCKRFGIIPGAFEPFEFRPTPHVRGDPFVVGCLARPARTKWNPELFNILNDASGGGAIIRAMCMGWDDALTNHCGSPPIWAECIPKGNVPSETFLRNCHALLCTSWTDIENWPRVGLEAMSVGVPIIADNKGGWLEMLDDGESGLLCSCNRHLATAIGWLASEEQCRMDIINAANGRVAALTEPWRLGRMWGKLLDGLG